MIAAGIDPCLLPPINAMQAIETASVGNPGGFFVAGEVAIVFRGLITPDTLIDG
ncbi:MAG: hypothetical protein PVH98_01815 [Gammaproteobacteria bacterium]|jgi:hypothetical protein